ncbi:MAG: hypothetical protein GMKNLPBB_00100 [Myxococcota bacterium]|nr:hypothetical protein [Myxococcota bacterium]
MKMRPIAPVAVLLGVLGWGCSSGGSAGDGGAAPVPDGAAADAGEPLPEPNLAGPYPYPLLSDYRFFAGALKDHVPGKRIHPYEMISPLWSDAAAKKRFIVLPEGAKIAYSDTEDWKFPVGTIIIKTFHFPGDFRQPEGNTRIIETRLLIHETAGWKGYVYLWNSEQTEAKLHIPGRTVMVSFTDEAGQPVSREYIVPDENKCKNCHAVNKLLTTLGPKTSQLNRQNRINGKDVNQIDWLAAQGAFDKAPSAPDARPTFLEPYGTGDLNLRARHYLDVNCAHCHQAGGGGGASALILKAQETNPAKYGVCKKPIAAGRGSGGLLHDIVPGYPEKSILLFRMKSLESDIKMPELPNLVVNEKGVKLISDWIAAMEPKGCPE